MLRNLSNFASLELINAEEIKGGCCVPNPCYPKNHGCKSSKKSKSKKMKKCKGSTKTLKLPKYSKNCGVQFLST